MTSTSEAVPVPPEDTQSKRQAAVGKATTVDGPYAKYVLGIMVLMGICNLIDRQIFSILAEDIKTDFGLSDSDMGFLFGTAFAVFYAIFGIPLGRLADNWNRTRLISLSVGFWSLMTALSGMARSFVPLAVCRFGVGVGEAGGSPAALSLLYDYFSPKVRTTVMGIYAGGVSIGIGIGLFLGGAILTAWGNAWPDPSLAPFGLKGWQVAFMAVGLPGLLLALLISTLKEPIRGQADGGIIADESDTATEVHPLRTLLLEMLPMLPAVNLWWLWRGGASRQQLLINVCVGLVITLLGFGLIQATGDVLQWLALGIGLYCVFSWAQTLAYRDPVCFGLVFQCKTLRYLYLYIGFQTFTGSAIGFWMVPWLRRYFDASLLELGTVLGLSAAIGGLIGMVLGGVIADKLRRYTQRGKLYIALVSSVLSLASLVGMLLSRDVLIAYGFVFMSFFVGPLGAAPAASTVNDLMIARTRAVAMALYIMIMNFMGVALGPYCVGLLSDSLTASGLSSGEALRVALLVSLVVLGFGIFCLLLAIKNVAEDEDSRLERARALSRDV